jgi:hypothetical protein
MMKHSAGSFDCMPAHTRKKQAVLIAEYPKLQYECRHIPGMATLIVTRCQGCEPILTSMLLLLA